jgi:hypothetical protein
MSPHGLSIARIASKSKNALAMSRGPGAPRAGDVLASGRRARADIHAISVVASEAHTSVARYPEAIEKVRELARRLGVDGWYTSDQTHYVRVATHRPEGDAT